MCGLHAMFCPATGHTFRDHVPNGDWDAKAEPGAKTGIVKPCAGLVLLRFRPFH